MLATWSQLLDGWGTSLTILIAGALLGWIGGTLHYGRLRRLAARTATRTDDLLLQASRGLWLPSAFFLSTLLALRFAPLGDDRLLAADRLAKVGLLVTLTLGGARFAGLWLARAEGGTTAQPSLVAKAVRGAVILVGAMLALQNSGLEIAPLITALGVGSLAIGLALQPTLSNFFAGVYLSMSKPIRVGDFIELEDGTQGEVVDIGWRATKVRQLANNLAIVPNSRLGEMRILNFSLPELPQAVKVELGVAYDSDLAQVERVALEVARDVVRELGAADSGFEPAVRFQSFGDSAIGLHVVLHARSATDRPALVHQFVKRIWERFAAEGIEIPYPQRVVRLRAEGPGELAPPA